MIIMVGYDLHRPGTDYDGLIKAIKEISGIWWHHLDSTWLIDTSLSPQQVFQRIKRHIDPNDNVLVIRLVNNPAFAARLSQKGLDWLNNRVY